MAPDLLGLRFLIVAGKGGVGRTTVAAALATLAARRGRRTLLAQVNAKDRLATLLGAPVGERVAPVRERLDAVNMNPTAALREYGLMVLKYEALYQAVLENRMVKGFLRAIPGLDDYSMLGKAGFHATERDQRDRLKYDLVIVDVPATGHAVTMLRLPQAILETVPEGPLTHTARRLSDLLHDAAQTAMVIVTLAEDLPVSETLDLYRANDQLLKLPLGAVIVNQLWPCDFEGQGGEARVLRALEQSGHGTADPVLAPLLVRARMACARRELNRLCLERLARELPLRQIHLPLLFCPSFTPSELEPLVQALDRQLPTD